MKSFLKQYGFWILLGIFVLSVIVVAITNEPFLIAVFGETIGPYIGLLMFFSFAGWGLILFINAIRNTIRDWQGKNDPKESGKEKQ